MGLKNNQLLLLDALVYYAELSDNNILLDEDNNENLNETEESTVTIGRVINSISRNKTVFDGSLGYSDKELGMNKIINLVSKDMDLTRLTIVYPDKVKDKTTSSVCLVDPVSFEVYVIYVGNYANDYNYYSDNNADGDYNDANEFTFINAWIENALGAVEADTIEQQRQLEFYEEDIY